MSSGLLAESKSRGTHEKGQIIFLIFFRNEKSKFFHFRLLLEIV
jgi:hypothetical protein